MSGSNQNHARHLRKGDFEVIHSRGGKAGCLDDILHTRLEIKGLCVCSTVSQRGRVKKRSDLDIIYHKERRNV